MSNKGSEKILMVQDPISGKHINIMPMFELINEGVTANTNTPEDLAGIVDMAIRHIGCSPRPKEIEGEVCDTFFFLYKLLDMFRAMKAIG